MRIKFLALLSLCFVLAGLAYGQTTLKANIPFAFHAGGKVLPAGQYDVLPQPGSAPIRVRSADSKTAVLVTIVTRLAGAMHTTPQDSHLIFDKVGENYFLSEVWIPGVDGYLLLSTTQQHEHRVIDIPR
jgi:hypothetical protein